MDVVNFIQDLPVAKTQNFQTNEVKKMSIQFSPNHDDEASIVKKYREYRKVTKDLVQTVLEKFVDNQSLRFAGRLMGILQQKTFMLESEEDMDFVMDFCLFEYQINGKNLWQRYQEEVAAPSEIEAEIIQASLLAYSSLFTILETDPEHGSVTLLDLFNDGKEIQIIDINLSETAEDGFIIFVRIIPFADFNMTSGIFCVFPENAERSLLKKIKIMMKKVKSEMESVQRFVAIFKLNKKIGLNREMLSNWE